MILIITKKGIMIMKLTIMKIYEDNDDDDANENRQRQ